jgi:hypothetical protein
MKAFEIMARPYKMRLADAETIRLRSALCEECPKNLNDTCLLCGCKVKKVMFQEASCGDKKW